MQRTLRKTPYVEVYSLTAKRYILLGLNICGFSSPSFFFLYTQNWSEKPEVGGKIWHTSRRQIHVRFFSWSTIFVSSFCIRALKLSHKEAHFYWTDAGDRFVVTYKYMVNPYVKSLKELRFHEISARFIEHRSSGWTLAGLILFRNMGLRYDHGNLQKNTN